MGDWKGITLADLEMLPVGYRQQISESYLDEFKHRNVIVSGINMLSSMRKNGAKPGICRVQASALSFCEMSRR